MLDCQLLTRRYPRLHTPCRRMWPIISFVACALIGLTDLWILCVSIPNTGAYRSSWSTEEGLAGDPLLDYPFRAGVLVGPPDVALLRCLSPATMMPLRDVQVQRSEAWLSLTDPPRVRRDGRIHESNNEAAGSREGIDQRKVSAGSDSRKPSGQTVRIHANHKGRGLKPVPTAVVYLTWTIT